MKPAPDDDETNICCATLSPRVEGGRVVLWWWCNDVDEEEDDDDDAVVATSAAVRAGFVDGPGPGNFLEVVCSSSEVDSLRGRLRRSKDDISSESTANERNSADLLLTHKVHLYSTKRVR